MKSYLGKRMVIFAGILMLATQVYSAEERIELEKGAIIGNSESPKATYIVPWRAISPVEIKGLEIGALLDEELEMIKPEVFRRQVELYHLRTNK